VLATLVHGDVQVEAILVDLGTGIPEWIEVREGHQVEYCAGPS
jgi:hypothetical protein